MTKFEKVSDALSEKTRNTSNFLRLTRNVDARWGKSYKYGIQNIHTNNLQTAFKTLNEIIECYDLKI